MLFVDWERYDHVGDDASDFGAYCSAGFVMISAAKRHAFTQEHALAEGPEGDGLAQRCEPRTLVSSCLTTGGL